MLDVGKVKYIGIGLILLVAALAFTTADSTAQTTKLTVTDAKALQVIEDVPLVVGKSTVVKVVVTAGARTSAKLTVSLGASTKVSTVRLVSGSNTLYIPVDAPSGPGTLQVVAKVTSTSGTGGNQVTKNAEVVALTKNELKVILLPVDWTDQDRANYFPAKYDSFASQSSDFFKSSYPLPEGNLHITKSTTNFMLSADERAIADAQGNLNWQNIMAMYSSIALAGQRLMPDTDLVVGVLPPKWFARNLNDPTVVGLELQAVRQAVANQVDTDYATLAHEAGHVFGRVDDYDFNLNPPKAISPTGKPVYFSFMGASDPTSQYWVDKSTYLAIMQTLQSGTLP
jgi:hypothetical protein